MTGWPWPLDGVQYWFESLWNAITRVAYDAAIYVWNLMPSWIRSAFSFMTNLASWLWNNMINTLNTLYSWVSQLVSWTYNAISSITNGIIGALQGTFNWVVSTLTNVINGVIYTVSNIVNGIVASVNNIAAGLYNAVATGINSLSTWLSQAIAGVAESMELVLHGAISGVAGAIGDGLKVLFEWVVASVGWVAEQIIGFLSWAADALSAPVISFIQTLTNRISGAMSPASPPEEIVQSVTDMVKMYQEQVVDQIEKISKSPLDINDIIGIATGITTTVIGAASVAMALGMAADAPHPQKELGARDTAKLILSYIGADRLAAPLIVVPHQEGVVTGLKQYFKRIYRLGLPGPESLARFLHREAIPNDTYMDYMARQGYPDEFSDAYKLASYTMPGVKELYEMNWRGLITDEELRKWIGYAGMYPDLVEPTMTLKELIPPAVDLVTMVVREAFIPEFVTPAPDVFAENMVKKGFSRVWADRYWTMHWVPMPITQAMDALHRDFITMDQFKTLLKIQDFHPMWHEPMAKVAYRTWRIRDMRIGWELGVLDDAALERRLLDYGYAPDDVDDIADVMKAYALAAEKGEVRREILADYVDGFSDEATLRSDLSEIGVPESVAEYYVKKAIRREERDRKKEQLKNIRRAFRKNLFTKEEAITELTDLGLDADRITSMVNYEETFKTIAVDEMKTLTVSQALSAFKKLCIDEPAVRVRLGEMNYKDTDIDVLICSNKPETELEEAKAVTASQALRAYQAEIITLDVVTKKLEAMGYAEADIEILLGLYPLKT